MINSNDDMQYDTDDVRIVGMHELIPPVELFKQLPLTSKASRVVYEARQEASDIIHGRNDRLLVVVGPCSVHDFDAAMDYAKRLGKLRDTLKQDLHIIMRVYFEKPRTSIGWKGLINDPDLDNSFQINKGLGLARKLLLDLANQEMPAATEYLDLISPQYVADLVSWAAIGARTTESQGHRELSSGISCPIGFKNGTYGNVNIAINAISAALRPHHFLSVTKEGRTAIFATAGNSDCHVILRGGQAPNYDADSVAKTVIELEKEALPPYLMIDFSHANSSKDYRRQQAVANDVAAQIAGGSKAIMGVMIESHLVEGNQKADGKRREDLVYGQSITDACIDWATTETMLQQLAAAVRERRSRSI